MKNNNIERKLTINGRELTFENCERIANLLQQKFKNSITTLVFKKIDGDNVKNLLLLLNILPNSQITKLEITDSVLENSILINELSKKLMNKECRVESVKFDSDNHTAIAMAAINSRKLVLLPDTSVKRPQLMRAGSSSLYGMYGCVNGVECPL